MIKMSFPIKTCVVCGEEFELKPGKPGFANRCPECSVSDEAPEQKKQQNLSPEERKAEAEANAALDRNAVDTAPPEQEAAGATHEQTPNHEPPPSLEQIEAMENAGIGESLKMANEFVKNPRTVYHHYLTKGGLHQIAESSSFSGGDGTASFGGARSVRAWIGDVSPGASAKAGTPVIEFTTAGGEVPKVRLYQGRPGAYWEVDALQVNIKSIRLGDGSTAIPDGPGHFKVTALDGKVTRMSAKELPE